LEGRILEERVNGGTKLKEGNGSGKGFSGQEMGGESPPNLSRKKERKREKVTRKEKTASKSG